MTDTHGLKLNYSYNLISRECEIQAFSCSVFIIWPYQYELNTTLKISRS